MDIINSISEQMYPLIDLLKDESDRGIVLAGVGFIDQCLLELLNKSFIDDKKLCKEVFEGNGLLSTFSSRINLAYLLGLIDEAFYIDLNLLRKIRNDCAHSYEPVDLSQSPFQDRIRELTILPEIITMLSNMKRNITSKQKEYRSNLIFFSTFICAWLLVKANHANKPTAPNFTEDRKTLFKLIIMMQDLLNNSMEAEP